MPRECRFVNEISTFFTAAFAFENIYQEYKSFHTQNSFENFKFILQNFKNKIEIDDKEK